MRASALERMRDVIQEDVGSRGLRADPQANLINACPGDFAQACRSLADCRRAAVAIVTGFYIPTGQPPAAETDGPLGALFLARALVPLGAKVTLATDPFCMRALETGIGATGLSGQVMLCEIPPFGIAETQAARTFLATLGPLTHLIAIERPGPNHTPFSIAMGSDAASLDTFLEEVPPESRDCCFTMRGREITAEVRPAHRLFDVACEVPGLTTIGIGDGGNEIGMGKIPWRVIRANIPLGGLLACRVATDWLIVAGISNWGAYGLAAGVYHLRRQLPPGDLFDAAREAALLQTMVDHGPLVDGVTGQPTTSVDGLPFERYALPLRILGDLAQASE